MLKISYYDGIKYPSSEFIARDLDFFGNGCINLTDFPLTYPATPNMTVQVGAGTAWVDGYRIANDSNLVTLTVAAASSQPRIDIIQIGHDDINKLPSLVIKQGVPGSSPIEPGADPGYLKLYAISVGANVTSISSSNVTDRRALVPLKVSGSQIQYAGVAGTSQNNTFAAGYTQTFAGTVALQGAVSLAAGQTFTNAGTITGGTINASSAPWSGLTGKPTTISGYGITDNLVGSLTAGANIAVMNPTGLGAATVGITGVIPIANGGTGSSTQNFVDTSTPQTIGGPKTFSSAPTVANTGGTDNSFQNFNYNAAPPVSVTKNYGGQSWQINGTAKIANILYGTTDASGNFTDGFLGWWGYPVADWLTQLDFVSGALRSRKSTIDDGSGNFTAAGYARANTFYAHTADMLIADNSAADPANHAGWGIRASGTGNSLDLIAANGIRVVAASGSSYIVQGFIDGNGNLKASGYGIFGNGVGTSASSGVTALGSNGQGIYLGWNYSSGAGEGDIFVYGQGGSGGLNIYNTNNASYPTFSKIFALDSAGNITTVGGGGVFASSKSLAWPATGYQKLPSGLILQWGAIDNVTIGNPGPNTTVTFPIAFPNGCMHAFATCVATAWATASNTGATTMTVTANHPTASGSASVRWFAIGY